MFAGPARALVFEPEGAGASRACAFCRFIVAQRHHVRVLAVRSGDVKLRANSLHQTLLDQCAGRRQARVQFAAGGQPRRAAGGESRRHRSGQSPRGPRWPAAAARHAFGWASAGLLRPARAKSSWVSQAISPASVSAWACVAADSAASTAPSPEKPRLEWARASASGVRRAAETPRRSARAGCWRSHIGPVDVHALDQVREALGGGQARAARQRHGSRLAAGAWRASPWPPAAATG